MLTENSLVNDEMPVAETSSAVLPNTTVINRVQTPPNAPKCRVITESTTKASAFSKPTKKRSHSSAVLKPLLKGEYKLQNDGKITWEGQWGMDEKAFEPGGYLSKFRYTYSHGPEPSEQQQKPTTTHSSGPTIVSSPITTKERSFPRDGYYNGYFTMGSSDPNLPPTKHTEKGLLITFSPEVSGNTKSDSAKRYVVKGSGRNQFGSFEFDGTFDQTSKQLELYRTYVVLSPRVRRASTRISRIESKPTEQGKSETKVERPAVVDNTHTIGKSRCGRVRRLPSHLVDDDDVQASDLHSRMIRALDAVISSDPDSWFIVPVDAEALGLADYHSVIKKPMDLGTVRKNLVEKKYSDSIAFANDVRLTFENAMKYNPPRHAVHEAAKGLLRLFERKLKELVKEPTKKKTQTTELPAAAESGGTKNKGTGGTSRRNSKSNGGKSGKGKGTTRRKVKSRTTDIDDMKTQIELMNRELDDLKSSQVVDDTFILGDAEGFIPIEKPPKMIRMANVTELTYQEKQDLGLAIHKLDTEQLNDVLNIIQQNGYTVYNEDGEVEIDFDLLDTITLRQLQRYVQVE